MCCIPFKHLDNKCSCSCCFMASVECSICLNEIRDPRVLSCGHTFCFQCIEDLMRNDGTLKCSQCSQVPKVHAGFTTAAAMPRNVTENDLIEELQGMRLSAANANANVGTAATSSTLNSDENTNLTICKECGHNRAIDDLIFCTNHSLCVCPNCCQLKHKQCSVVDAAEHASNVLLADKVSLENAQCMLDKSAKRLTQDINHSVACLKQWADAFNKAQALYEKTGQLIQNRLRGLSKEVSSNRELLADLLTSKVNAAALLYSGDWTTSDKLVATCAVYTEVDWVTVAGFAKANIFRRLGKHDTPAIPQIADELVNINADELLQQIEDKLDRIATMNPSFYVLRGWTNDFIKLSDSCSGWVQLPLMKLPEPKRNGFSAAACGGKIYVIGGDVTTWSASNIVQQYDTQTGWQDWPPMLEERSFCGATALGGRLFAVGGGNGKRVLSSAEECDLKTGRWTQMAPLTAARKGVAVAALGNLLFAVGGRVVKSGLNSVNCYDLRAGRWTKAASMHESRVYCGCAALGDRLYVAGGRTHVGQWTASVEFFDLRAGRWTRVRDMGVSRVGFALAVLNGQLVAASGWEEDTVELYDEKRDVWSTLDVRLPCGGGQWAGCVLEE